MSEQPYKLLIKGTLEQKTAFSIGGNRDNTSDIDMPLAKDGNDNYTIRGSGLAGAFIATARKLYSKGTIGEQISEDTPEEQRKTLENKFKKQRDKKGGIKKWEKWKEQLSRMEESVWIFHHAHPVNLNLPEELPEVRDNVAIRQKTGAAKHGAKFESETLPAGTQWDFLLEVDEYRDEEKTASGIALNVIEEWKKHCWLGRDVARGLGWMQLTDVTLYQLDSNDVGKWPDSSNKPLDVLTKLNAKKPTDYRSLLNSPPQACHGSITITVGENKEGYGIDLLSVGGNNGGKQDDKKIDYPKHLQGKKFLSAIASEDKNKVISPLGLPQNTYLKFDKKKEKDEDNDIDFNLATTQTADGKLIPYIPGSSLRGSLRHALSWLLRKNNENIWEPGGKNKHPDSEKPDDYDIALKLFGSTRQSASLLISDAMPVNDNWQVVVLEMHAEDEFTQGAYGSSKFDRTCLTKGTFKADFYLEAKDKDQLKDMRKELETLKALGKNQMIPIGGGQWKGLGWVKMDIQFTETDNIKGDNND